MDKSRTIKTLNMGANEAIARQITIPASWGSSPGSPSNKLFDKDGADVSGTKLTGVPGISGSVFTTSRISGLVAGETYLLQITFAESGNTFEAEGYIVCDD